MLSFFPIERFFESWDWAAYPNSFFRRFRVPGSRTGVHEAHRYIERSSYNN